MPFCCAALIPAEQPQDPEQAEEDRHNFALARDGAKLIAANREAKKASAVLDSDGDTFCKNECKADKWIIIELSQVAKVDAVELSQVNHLHCGSAAAAQTSSSAICACVLPT